MKAIILAAGRGSRMNSATDHQPKCFSKLHGKRLIEWQLEALQQAGIDDITIVRGYLAEAFQYCCKYIENPRWQETNMFRSLYTARDVLLSSTCIVSYSDIIYSSNSVRRLLESVDDIAMTYDPNWLSLWSLRFSDPLSDAETFKINTLGYVTEIGSRPQVVEEIQGQYMGLCRFTSMGWRIVEKSLSKFSEQDVDIMDMTGLFRHLILSGIKIKGIKIHEPWYEVDSLADLEKYHRIDRNALL
ncbi:MAG: hypothetical protein A3F18_02715 [Legionellales bacterium RIFCSPHIGHO2_12_FULL_37_14]|nr:MAG: hypothetical protein A3F18_02715 [Legionellales bacterium RIFCSPHIGHO2_12_FULL_37_14]